MKTVIDTLLQRRSTRRYEREAISEQDLGFIFGAIRNTPTSYNGQQYSVIDISDQSLKEKLAEITEQKQIKTCNRFLVFCADYNKIKVIADAKGLEMPRFNDTLDGVMVGVIDASLAMMSALVAAEACGLGTCCIGYTRTAAPEKISQLLQLPQGVFVVCGLAIGIPREVNEIKPKQPKSLIIHNNTYREDDMTPDLLEYDKKITAYNATRSGSTTDNDWAGHIIDYYYEAMNYDMLKALCNRGFDIIS